jgi:hypothetical protein
VSPVKYEQGFCIPEDDILRGISPPLTAELTVPYPGGNAVNRIQLGFNPVRRMGRFMFLFLARRTSLYSGDEKES